MCMLVLFHTPREAEDVEDQDEGRLPSGVSPPPASVAQRFLAFLTFTFTIF